jgi:hypothetical protein
MIDYNTRAMGRNMVALLIEDVLQYAGLTEEVAV